MLPFALQQPIFRCESDCNVAATSEVQVGRNLLRIPLPMRLETAISANIG